MKKYKKIWEDEKEKKIEKIWEILWTKTVLMGYKRSDMMEPVVGKYLMDSSILVSSYNIRFMSVYSARSVPRVNHRNAHIFTTHFFQTTMSDVLVHGTCAQLIHEGT